MKAVLILALIGFAAAIEFDRPCRAIPVVNNFSLQQYAGNWYELKRYETTLQQNGDCTTFDYSYDFEIANPTSLNVTIRWSYIATNAEVYHHGTAALVGGSTDGRLSVNWDHRPETINYHVLATDYEFYSVVWDCQELDGGRSNEDAWVLSRYQTLSDEHADEVRAVVGDLLNEDLMRYTYQGANCLNIEG